MAIKPLPQSIPTALPPAKLYLDDIGDILRILTDSDMGCQARLVAGTSKCDTLDDLKGLGGRTTHFVMDISSPGKHQTLELTPSATRIYIYETGDQLAAWSKYVNVAAIFEKRKLRLKTVANALGWRILAALWLLSMAGWMLAPYALKPLPVYDLPRLATAVLVAAATVYYFLSSQSIVYLRQPHKVGVVRWLQDHKPEIVVGFACVLLGALASQIVTRVWK